MEEEVVVAEEEVEKEEGLNCTSRPAQHSCECHRGGRKSDGSCSGFEMRGFR